MRLLSLNVWGGQLFNDLLNYLKQVDVDVYCLQEVFNAQISLTTNMFEIMPQVRIDLFRRLCENLPGHQGYFFPACEKFPHYPAVGDIVVPYGIATFVRKGVPVIRHGVDFVHGEFALIPRGEVPFPRNAHAFQVLDRKTHKITTIAHMHGLWQEGGKGDSEARHQQAHAFLDILHDMSPQGRKIACGDWNVLPDSQTFRILSDGGLNRELVTAGNFQSTRTSHYKKETKFADYMCVDSDIQVQSFEVVEDPEVSDHCPLLLEFE